MKPDCKITLVFKPVGDRCFQTKSVFLSSIFTTETSHPFMHWEVCCEFDDGKSFKFEALLDKGHLVPCMRPAGRNTLLCDKVFFGVFKRSFEDISNAYHALSELKKYDVVKNNCQTWVVAFLEELSLPVPEEVRRIAKTIQEIFHYGKRTAYHFVVQEVGNAYRYLIKPHEGSAPEEKEEDKNTDDDDKKQNESRISYLSQTRYQKVIKSLCYG
ncbi:uncharacterized protein LOC125945903 [Dermacentor silvarum]|uniref:uncharacterized protein LOC125945903 n=1 Tax=Dermacentor silvarum TaxID=543639 RepID=UPI002101CC5C|nr:uncharacterized protein LOC125945903 [Dermacentor silvarum]